MPMQVASFVNDQIANLGNRHEKFGVSPADMLVRVSPNQLRKPDVILTVKGYAEEMINGVEVGFELLDEINLLPRQPVVIDTALWSRHVCYTHARQHPQLPVCCCRISSHRIFISCDSGDYGCNDTRMK